MATNIYDYALPFVRKQTTIFDAYEINLLFLYYRSIQATIY